MLNFATLRWFVFFIASCLIASFIQYKGLFAALWQVDSSGISFAIIAIYFMLSLYIGVLTRRLTSNHVNSDIFKTNLPYLNSCWYASELLMALGMMGTLIGFTLMLGPALAGLDPANTSLATAAILKMASGMSTAILTTLTGLITSQLTKIQIINIETVVDSYDAENEKL